MIIAHITKLQELILLSKIQKDHPINPELYIDIHDLRHINRSISLFMHNVVFNFEETTMVLRTANDENAYKFSFKYNPDNRGIYNELDPDDIISVVVFNFKDNTEITIPYL